MLQLVLEAQVIAEMNIMQPWYAMFSKNIWSNVKMQIAGKIGGKKGKASECIKQSMHGEGF